MFEIVTQRNDHGLWQFTVVLTVKTLGKDLAIALHESEFLFRNPNVACTKGRGWLAGQASKAAWHNKSDVIHAQIEGDQ